MDHEDVAPHKRLSGSAELANDLRQSIEELRRHIDEAVAEMQAERQVLLDRLAEGRGPATPEAG